MKLTYFFMSTKKSKYRLCCDLNVLIALEEMHGITLNNLSELFSGSLKYLRTLLFLMLQKHHSEEFKKETDVVNFIDDIGGISNLSEVVISALQKDGVIPTKAEEASETEGKSQQ